MPVPDTPLRAPVRLVVAALLACGCGGGGAPAMTLVRVQRDLLAELEGGAGPAWRAVRHPDGLPPMVEVLTPSIDNESDAADRLALVMPPPCEVQFRVRPEDGPVVLDAAAGVDLAVARHLSRSGRGASLAVDFEVLVDGERRFHATVTTEARAPQNDGAPGRAPHVWHRVGAADGLALEPGQVVTLRTALPAGAPPGMARVPAGFGGLVLERRVERPRTRASAERPNLVLIVVDTERADRTSAYGYGRETTPSLERLARRGTRFEAAYATSSWTWPSTASILTGRLPEGHGVVDFRSCWMADELVTLAEALQEAGFTTGGFSGNPLVSAHRNFDQGFEHFQATPECAKGEAVVPPALEWLEQNREHRFFLYVHLHDPHVPHSPRRAELERFCGVDAPRLDPMLFQARTMELRNASAHTADDRPRPELLISAEEARWYSDVYDACVASGDWWVGVLLDQLEAFGLSESTLVAYTSDHGEELLDHGMLNHNHDLWEELVRVPLVLAGPGLAAGATVATPVSNRHLAPTLARLAGAPFPAPDDALDLARPAELLARPVYLDTRHGWWKGRQFVDVLGVVDEGWVLHWCPQGKPWDAPDGADPAGSEERLFDLAADPRQERDLSDREPARVERMRALVLGARARAAAERPESKRRAGAATMELLRGAGYAGGGEDER